MEQGGLPAIVEEILTVSGMGALPILVVNNKVYKYGSFLLIDAIEDVLDIGLSIQVEEE